MFRHTYGQSHYKGLSNFSKASFGMSQMGGLCLCSPPLLYYLRHPASLSRSPCPWAQYIVNVHLLQIKEAKMESMDFETTGLCVS